MSMLSLHSNGSSKAMLPESEHCENMQRGNYYDVLGLLKCRIC